MARKLDSFPNAPGSRYPWDEWLDGSVWLLSHGEDYTAKTATFRSIASTQAKKRGGRIRTRTHDAEGRDSVVIQFERS
jgi:hypothetical protein